VTYVWVSDEEDDNRSSLLYLPISPDIEDVEESHAVDQQVTDCPALYDCCISC